MTGIIGDLHLKENLGYSSYIKDGREAEKQEILDFIVNSLKDCDTIIFLGDQFNARNNPSRVIKEFVAFLERFNGKQLYILTGNHEIDSFGKTALDFLKELKKKDNWHVITDTIESINGFTFCPYFTKSQLAVKTDEEGIKMIMNKLEDNNILFIHSALSETSTTSGIQTNIFNEIVLPRKELEKRFKLVIGGHIHKPKNYGNTIVAGSIFNQEVCEIGKSIWRINEDTLEIEEIKLPGRGIYKLTDPTNTDLNKIKEDSIVKVILTKKITKKKVEELKDRLGKFDAFVLIEDYPKERKKLVSDKNVLEFEVEELIGLYAKQKQIDLNKLLNAFELIK